METDRTPSGETRAAPTERAPAERAAAERAAPSRGHSWPAWLYGANAVLLGAFALAVLAGPVRMLVWAGVAGTAAALNLGLRRRMGARRIVLRGRGVPTCFVVAVLCMASAVLVGPERPAVVVALAVAGVTSYLLAAVLHRRASRA